MLFRFETCVSETTQPKKKKIEFNLKDLPELAWIGGYNDKPDNFLCNIYVPFCFHHKKHNRVASRDRL